MNRLLVPSMKASRAQDPVRHDGEQGERAGEGGGLRPSQSPLSRAYERALIQIIFQKVEIDTIFSRVCACGVCHDNEYHLLVLSKVGLV